ncbi:hypothetical protein HLK59_34735 [Streptomyces sp. S3(2020)]|uniref:hypothetical protein n=1 Tax=Streptomyces sp. S3(2020) TaxID=2732044 RepID=UPI0014897D99|nr:hypothetical protein [Streptomyces sp. S3(2020)]NNN35439.1 hypothetical protein [Streptomyces sp. S3(2020)]
MSEQQGQQAEHVDETRRRRVGIVGFIVGLVAGLAFFAFFPGLPHVIDWGAILVSLAVGLLARWGCQSWVARAAAGRADGD